MDTEAVSISDRLCKRSDFGESEMKRRCGESAASRSHALSVPAATVSLQTRVAGSGRLAHSSVALVSRQESLGDSPVTPRSPVGCARSLWHARVKARSRGVSSARHSKL